MRADRLLSILLLLQIHSRLLADLRLDKASDGALIKLRVSRIRDAAILEESFVRPPDFDLAASVIAEARSIG